MDGYNPANRTYCADIRQWKTDRRVRIMHDAFGLRGKIGNINGVDSRHVYVRIRYSKKIGDQEVIAYLPNHLRLLDKGKY